MNRNPIAIARILSARLMLVALAAQADDLVVSDISQVPKVEWNGVNGTLYHIESAPAVTGVWTVADQVFAFSNAIHRWGDLASPPTPQKFYRVVALASTNGAISTKFETAEGWTTHAEGDWTNIDGRGTWISGGAAAMDDVIRSFSPVRYIVFDDTNDELRLPQIDNPGRFYFWLNASDAFAEWTVRVQEFDGLNWNNLASFQATGTTYRQLAAFTDYAFPAPARNFRFLMLSNSAGSACLDNVRVQSIQALNSVSSEIAGTGQDGATAYSGQLADKPVKPGSVQFSAGAHSFQDNGSGGLTGAPGGSGMMSYETGVWSLDFDGFPPTNGTVISVDYQWAQVDPVFPVQTNEVIATGNGVSDSFSGTLAHAPPVLGSLTVRVGGFFFRDDGDGHLLSNFGPAVDGIINYRTGQWTLDFDTIAPESGSPLSADYAYWP